MKIRSELLAVLFAASVMAAPGVHAADAASAPKSEGSDSTAMKMEPHSHMREKHGTAPAASKTKAMRKADAHDHQKQKN